MRLDRALTEAIRMERFEELYVGLEAGRLSCEDAAMILGCSTRHFHELARRNHALRRGYTWTRLVLLQARLAVPSKRGGSHRLRLRGSLSPPDRLTQYPMAAIANEQ